MFEVEELLQLHQNAHQTSMYLIDRRKERAMNALMMMFPLQICKQSFNKCDKELCVSREQMHSISFIILLNEKAAQKVHFNFSTHRKGKDFKKNIISMHRMECRFNFE